jgi:UDP-N-acetyl-D-glucosamine dehydrogenase
MGEAVRGTPTVKERLKRKLLCRSVHAGVIGLGRHGLPVAVGIARAGFAVTGIDVDGRRVATINTGHVDDAGVLDSLLLSLVGARRLRATQSLMALEHLDVVTVCVPTPSSRRAGPDLSYVIAAAEAIRIHLHPGLLIAIESGVAPDIPTRVLMPILRRSGLQVGADFFLAQRLRHVVPGPWLGPAGAAATNVVGETVHCRELGALYYQLASHSVLAP